MLNRVICNYEALLAELLFLEAVPAGVNDLLLDDGVLEALTEASISRDASLVLLLVSRFCILRGLLFI